STSAPALHPSAKPNPSEWNGNRESDKSNEAARSRECRRRPKYRVPQRLGRRQDSNASPPTNAISGSDRAAAKSPASARRRVQLGPGAASRRSMAVGVGKHNQTNGQSGYR